jgi:hypothetical protein
MMILIVPEIAVLGREEVVLVHQADVADAAVFKSFAETIM